MIGFTAGARHGMPGVDAVFDALPDAHHLDRAVRESGDASNPSRARLEDHQSVPVIPPRQHRKTGLEDARKVPTARKDRVCLRPTQTVSPHRHPRREAGRNVLGLDPYHCLKHHHRVIRQHALGHEITADWLRDHLRIVLPEKHDVSPWLNRYL